MGYATLRMRMRLRPAKIYSRYAAQSLRHGVGESENELEEHVREVRLAIDRDALVDVAVDRGRICLYRAAHSIPARRRDARGAQNVALHVRPRDLRPGLGAIDWPARRPDSSHRSSAVQVAA